MPTPPPVTPDASAAALDRLRAIADGIPNAAFAGRLRRVFEAGAQAIAGLGNLGLDKYDDLNLTGAPDLSMWEEVAPVIRDTLLDVNRLLTTMRELFPTGGGALGDLIGEALGEASAGNPAEMLQHLHEQEATQQIHQFGNALAAEVSNLGERMRSPQVVSDRWNLLTDLQEFRGKFRSLVGDLLFLTASCFAAVDRAQVVPGFTADLQDAIVARRSVTDLARVMAMHAAKLKAATPEQVGAAFAALVKDLDAFGRSKSYSVLRTSDKRRFVEFRALLRQLADKGAIDARQAAAAVTEFADFTQGLSSINRRNMLIEHDREVIAACCVKLEGVDQLTASRPAEAVPLFKEAVAQAISMYGRNPSLDAYLRKARKRDWSAMGLKELEQETELLRSLLASASAF